MKTKPAPIANDLTAKKVKAPVQGYSLHKTTQKRLFLRVSASGSRVWECHYRVNGRREKLTLGAVNDVSFNQARARSLDITEIAKGGTSPKPQIEREAHSGKTVADLLDEFDKRHLAKLGNPKTQRGRVNRWIRATLGKRLLASVCKDDFIKLRNAIQDTGATHEHVRIMKLCRQIWQFAVDQGWMEESPFPSQKFPVPKRTRYLSGAEIARLWKDADTTGNNRQCPFNQAHTIAWKLLILTGQRISSLLYAEKRHFDLEQGLWIIPASLMKTQNDQTGQAHTVHLSSMAVGLVQELLSQQRGKYLFTGLRSNSKPVSANWYTTRHREWLAAMGIPHATVHDYRRALSTHCADLGIAPHIVEKILAHEMGGMLAVYNRGQYLAGRKEALVAYSDWLGGLVAKDNVVPLRRIAK